MRSSVGTLNTPEPLLVCVPGMDQDLKASVLMELEKAGAAIESTGNSVRAWLDAYAAKDGWHRLDQAQRRLEALLIDVDDPDERPLGLVRRAYEDACHAMAVGFVRQLTDAHWVIPGASSQTKIFPDFVSAGPKPVAYFLVDSLRFEMGTDLCARLPKTAEVNVHPALVSLPSITTVGMAALMPGASGSFDVVEQNGKLGCVIEKTFLPDLTARKRFAAARVPGLVDMTLDDLLGLTQGKLTKKIEAAQVIVVRSQEIDFSGALEVSCNYGKHSEHPKMGLLGKQTYESYGACRRRFSRGTTFPGKSGPCHQCWSSQSCTKFRELGASPWVS